ncbi:allatostatin-A receptor-like [Oculina patagonica]
MSSFELPPRSLARVTLESISWSILAMAGFLGNILVFVAFLRNPLLRKFTPVYIIALAISDILSFVTNNMFVAVTLYTGKWQFGNSGCFVCGFSVIFLMHVSTSTMSLTAINRYIRVTKPELFKKIFAPKTSIVIVVCLWLLVALVTLLPFAFGAAEFAFLPSSAVCVLSLKHKITNYAMAIHGTFTTISLLIAAVCYSRVSRAIKRILPRDAQNENGDGQVDEASENGEAVMKMREVKITKMMYAIVLAFAILWIPIAVIIMVIRVSLGTIPREISMLVPYAYNISSLINPVMYAGMNRPFRREFKMILLSVIFCVYCG